jgi:signal transduction histidine kinase
MGYTQLLYLKVSDDENREKLKRIEKNSDELCQILDQLRQYFQKGKNIKTKTNLNDVIHHLNSYFEDIEKRKQIDVEILVDETIPDQYLNFGQIENLVMILTDNAVRAIEHKYDNSDGRPPGSGSGKIQIKTHNLNSDFLLIIKDNGIGIKQKNQSNIWMPFYSEFTGGTGIGLLGCEKILANHDARARVDSREGAGTEFEILFPKKT